MGSLPLQLANQTSKSVVFPFSTSMNPVGPFAVDLASRRPVVFERGRGTGFGAQDANRPILSLVM
jgi:hypothetical protein